MPELGPFQICGITIQGIAGDGHVLLVGPGRLAGPSHADRPSVVLLISALAVARLLDRLQPLYSVGLVKVWHTSVAQSLLQQWQQHRRSVRLQPHAPSAEQLFRAAAEGLQQANPQPLTERSQWIGSWVDRKLEPGRRGKVLRQLEPRHLAIGERMAVADKERQTR